MIVADETGQPTVDEKAGMDWWNAMTEAERDEALRSAGWQSGSTYTPSAADAWALYKKRIGKGANASRTMAVGDLANDVDAYFGTFGGDSHDV